MKHNRIFLLSFFVLFMSFILFLLPDFSEAASFSTTKWEIINNTLFITYTGSSSPLSFDLIIDSKGDKYFLITGFPAGTQINLQDNWSLDTDGNAVTVEDMSKVTKYDGSNINIKGRNKITIKNYNNIKFTGRYTMPLIAAHYQAWYREPRFSSKDSWLTENYEYNWTLRMHGSESTVPYFHADKTIPGTGQGEIASWQYPMINFYDSRNFELQRYHAAEMKIAGINTVIFDFYGAVDVRSTDYKYPRENSDAFIKNVLDPAGMNYLVFYEEFSATRNAYSTSEAKERIKRSFEWLNSNWFNRKGYVKYNNRPVVMLFVTRDVLNSVEEWNSLASQAGVNPLPLFLVQDAWINGNLEGAFNWMPVNDSANANLPRKIYTGNERISLINKKFQEFLQKTENHEYLITTAYPGFNGSVLSEIGRTDYDNYDIINFDNGETFKQTFNLSLNANPNIIQLGTWNDYNEDTVIEPSMSALSHSKTETSRGYSSLEYVQACKNEWENYGWTAEDLRAPVELYNLAMSPALTQSQKNKIDAAYNAIFQNNAGTLRNIISSLGISYNTSLNPVLRAEITTTELHECIADIPYNVTLKASGSGPFVWSLTSGKLPDGLKLNSSTGTISGTASTAGTFTFTVQVQNSASVINKADNRTFTLTVIKIESNYKIFPDILPDGTLNKFYSTALSVQSITSNVNVKWKISGGRLPNGLQLDENTGTISGIPSRLETAAFTVTASFNNETIEKILTLRISDTDLGITTSALKNGTIRKKYKATLKAYMNTPLTWKAQGLPDGLEISYDDMKKKAIISGVPTVSGTFNVTINASNTANSFKKSFQLTIKNVKPKFITKKLPEAFINQPYFTQLEASGGEINDKLIWSISWKNAKIIDGLNLNNNNASIFGTPLTNRTGNYKVKVVVMNSAGRKTKIFTIKLKADNLKLSTASENIFAGNNDKIFSGKTIAVENNGIINDEKSSSEINSVENIFTCNNDQISFNKNRLYEFDDETSSRLRANYIKAAELGIISVDESGQYDFDIILSDDIPANSKLIWRANSSEGSEDDNIADFYDDTGAEITGVPENHLLTVSSWLNKGIIYRPVVLIEVYE